MVDKTLYKCTQKKQKVNNSNPTKTGDELGCFGKVSISCSTNGTCRVINYIMLWNYVVAVAFNGKEKPPTCLNSLSTHRPLHQVVTDKPRPCIKQSLTNHRPCLKQSLTNHRLCLKSLSNHQPLPQTTDLCLKQSLTNHRPCLKSMTNLMIKLY